MLTEVEGVRVGHVSDEDARTGCTVILFPEGTVASGEVRGGAPATRDFALLEPGRLVERLDAVVMSGGSAFGLAAAEGVMAHLADQDIGFPTAGGPVPIVVGMSLFDLNEGDGSVRPTPADGRLAAELASTDTPALGRVGAATGATIDKWRGRHNAKPGWLGGAVVRMGDVVVAALVAVNASGTLDDGAVMAEIDEGRFDLPAIEEFENTTIGVIVTNAKLTKTQCHLVAQSGHDGFARAIVPVHTQGDGDALVAAATGEVEADVRAVRVLAVRAVERAIRDHGIS